MNKCDLCNEERELREGTFMKGDSSGGIAMLCDRCWNKVNKKRCSLCGSVAVKGHENPPHTIYENKQDARGGYVCDDCRYILDWNNV